MKSTILALILSFTAAFAPSATAKSSNVQLTLEAVHCMQLSKNSSDNHDRLCAFVRGRTGTKDFAARLPADRNYYRSVRDVHLQNPGWIDRYDEKHPTPVLWSGHLRDGETARFSVVMAAEQNPEMSVNGADLSDLLGAHQVANYVEENKYDVLGSFTVVMKNIGGRLQVTWNPGDYTSHSIGDGNALARGRDAAFFGMGGPCGASYNMIANAAVK